MNSSLGNERLSEVRRVGFGARVGHVVHVRTLHQGPACPVDADVEASAIRSSGRKVGSANKWRCRALAEAG